MNGGAMDLLLWARGTGFAIAVALALFGVVVRLVEIFALGRKADRAPARAGRRGSGWRTLLTRSVPAPGLLRSAPVTYVAGYVFHIGLFVVLFLLTPHILLLAGVLGVSWPALPTAVVDAVTVLTLIALAVVLANRLGDPVKRFLSGVGDYVAWLLTALPVISGYLAYHHLAADYTLMLALHILSAELLLAALPFTKLAHAFTFAIARWYTGALYGRKGVAA